MHIMRLATVHEPDVDALPPEFRAGLTEQDVAAIRTGPAYFATLAGADSPGWLRAVLAGCAGTPCDLQFYSFDGAPYRPYFRCYWQGEPVIGLPRPGPLRADLPPFLRRLYGVIGAFRENGFEYAGGLQSGDALESVTEAGMGVKPGGPIDPAVAVPFLGSLSGSELCYLPDGSGAWLESCQFRRVENLEREVARYFEALLKGTRI
jgi:hypothetical protein